MSRTLSAVGQASVNANQTGEEWILLLTLNHADFGAPIRYARRATSFTSNGNVFSPFFFDLSLPDQTPDTLPRWNVTIGNVDQAALAELRALATAPDIQIDVVRASAPNTIEMTTGGDYKIKSISYGQEGIVAEISMEDLIGEGFPGGRILPSNFPGGF